MEKYVIVNTGEEVELGDLIKYVKERKTSFGTFKEVIEFVLTPERLHKLIDEKVVKQVKNKSTSETPDDLGFYIKIAADKIGCTTEELIKWLDKMNKVCPKAVLDFLLQIIAVKFYTDKPKAFNDATEYYSLKPKDGTVGKVYNMSSYIPLFKSIEDAEKARVLLKEQLDLMYGRQS